MKSDKGKTPLIVLRCADNRQLFEGTGKGNGEAMKYAIYEGNIDRLEKKLKRISNKCKAYGCDFHYEQTGEEFRELKDEKGNKHTARFVLVEAEGTAIINDWEFIAELEHTENGNIITGVAGVEVPERYYTSKPMCEHCNSKRFRKNTYIVRNKQTGEFKQVGKSCLKDFTHGMSAEAVTQYMAEYSKLYITNNGQALMAKMIAGSGNIDFTKVCSSSTQYTESQLQALTALSNIKQTKDGTRKFSRLRKDHTTIWRVCNGCFKTIYTKLRNMPLLRKRTARRNGKYTNFHSSLTELHNGRFYR